MTKGQALLDFLRKLGFDDNEKLDDFFDDMDRFRLIEELGDGKPNFRVDPEDYYGEETPNKNDPNYIPEVNQYAVYCRGFASNCKYTYCVNCKYKNFWKEEYANGERMQLGKPNERLADCASRLRAMWGEDWVGVLEMLSNHPEEALEIFGEDMIHESNNILDEISKIKMGEKE